MTEYPEIVTEEYIEKLHTELSKLHARNPYDRSTFNVVDNGQ